MSLAQKNSFKRRVIAGQKLSGLPGKSRRFYRQPVEKVKLDLC